jgi:hypothetical protein
MYSLCKSQSGTGDSSLKKCQIVAVACKTNDELAKGNFTSPGAIDHP